MPDYKPSRDADWVPLRSWEGIRETLAEFQEQGQEIREFRVRQTREDEAGADEHPETRDLFLARLVGEEEESEVGTRIPPELDEKAADDPPKREVRNGEEESTAVAPADPPTAAPVERPPDVGSAGTGVGGGDAEVLGASATLERPAEPETPAGTTEPSPEDWNWSELLDDVEEGRETPIPVPLPEPSGQESVVQEHSVEAGEADGARSGRDMDRRPRSVPTPERRARREQAVRFRDARRAASAFRQVQAEAGGAGLRRVTGLDSAAGTTPEPGSAVRPRRRGDEPGPQVVPDKRTATAFASPAAVRKRLALAAGAGLMLVVTILVATTRPAKGTLTLTVVPADADVVLPDAQQPYRPGIRLAEGVHRVIVRRSGYREAERRIDVSGATRERIVLEKIPPPVAEGTLTLTVVPADARVILPDSQLRYRPGIRLREGLHRVIVQRAGYREVERRINVSGRTRERIVLERIVRKRASAPFTVDATPAGARVRLLDGGGSYRPGVELPPGRYRVEVSAAGYETEILTVSHSESRTLRRVSLRRLLRPGVSFSDELANRRGSGPAMVVLPGGRFRMGCQASSGCADRESPGRQVQVNGFALSKHEVTRDEFSRFADATGHRGGGSCRIFDGEEWATRSGRGWSSPGFRQTGKHPVVCVSWEDATSYAHWLSRETGESYRLPSEAEWEYAARAGSTTDFHFGSRSSSQCRWANGADLSAKGEYPKWRVESCRDGYAHTAPVGTLGANDFGLYDMHGNVWEWVQDCWNSSYRSAPSNGSAWLRGDCSRRILRGGSWSSPSDDLRSAHRERNTPEMRYHNLGFRVARDVSR